MTKLPNQKYLSIHEAAELLKVSTKTLRRWEESGKLIPQRTDGGHRRYLVSKLEVYKKQPKPKAPAKPKVEVVLPYISPKPYQAFPEAKIEPEVTFPGDQVSAPQLFVPLHINQAKVLKRAAFAGAFVVVALVISSSGAFGSVISQSPLLRGLLGSEVENVAEIDSTENVLATRDSLLTTVLNIDVDTNISADADVAGNLNLSGNRLSSSDDLVISPTGGGVAIGGGTPANIDLAGDDLLVSGDLESNGDIFAVNGTLTGDLTLTGTLISTGDLVIDPTGGGVSVGTGTAGSVDLAGDDLYVTGDFEVDGTSYIPTLVIGGDSFTDLTGTGLQVSSGSLQTTLGTSVATGEIDNDTILEIDLDATNDPTAGFALTYDSSSGGFTWTDITGNDENGIETVQESDVTINSVTATTIDFLGGDFDLSESPAGELNVQLATVLASVTGVAGNFDVAGQLVAGTADAFTVTTAGEIQIPSTQTLQIGNIELNDSGSDNLTSGAVLIGVFDEFTNSTNPANLQVLLNDLDAAIGAGSSKWAQDTGFIYIANTTDDLVLGDSTIAAASLYFDESAASLYLGTNETTNGTLTLYSSGVGITDASITTDSSGNLIIDSANFDVTSTGINATAIGSSTRAAGAFTTLAANSTVTFSSLVTDGPVITTSGVLSSEATLALTRGGTGRSITASNGQVVYSDADSFELTTSGVTDECLKFQSGSAPIWEECVTSAQVPFTSDGSVITKTTIGEYLSLRYGDAADTQLEIQNTTTGTIPAADTMAINLTGGTTGIVTDGADGLYIAAEYGNGTTNTNSLLHLDLDPVNTPSGDETFYALNIDGLTGSSATEAAINIGSGWDSDINLSDTSPTISIGNTGTLSITDGTNTLFTIADDTSEGDVTATGDLAVNGATSADITSTTATATLFNSGVTTLNIGGAATAINFGDGAVTGTIDIGGVTADGATTVNIATNSTSADAITIGNTNAATTLALTGGDDWSISNGGVITLSASGAQTTAIIVTDTDYTNAISVGDNNIIGTTAAINFNNFDVDSDGKVIIAPDTSGDALTLTLPADARGLVVDAASTDTTTTTGVVDLNIDAGNAAVLGLNIDFAQSDGAADGTDATAQNITLSANDATGDVFGVVITGNSTANAAAGSYEALLKLVNAEPTIGVVTDGILIDSTSGTDTDITDAIDVSDSNIVNAINIGANAIAGTNFAVSAGGTISIASGQTLTIGTTSLNETTGSADSGAFLVGVFPEFSNSVANNVQDVLDDLDAAIGAGSSKWSINTTPTPDVLYPTASDTTAGNDFALGGTTITAAPFAVDVSANTIYVGDAATAGSTSVIFKSDAGGDTGTLAYNTDDQFNFTGGDVLIGQTLTLSTGAGAGITGGGLVDCDGATDKLVWDVTSAEFACGEDGGAGSGSSKWTDNGAITYLTATGDDLIVGSDDADTVAPFYIDVSANTVRIGDASVAGNAVLSLYASDGTTGNLTYNTSDQFQFSGGDVLLDQDLTVSGGDIVGAATTNLLNTTSTTINFGGAATAVNIADAAITGTIDIGGVTADGTTTVNIATNGGANADVVNIGNSLAATTVAITGGDDWSITAAGALDINGQFDLGDGGDTGTINTSDWDINATGDASGIGAITADGAIAFTPGSTSDIVFTGDADSNFQITSTVASDVTLNVADITINATGTGSTNTLNGLSITNAAAAGTTTPDSLIYIAQSDTDETVTNGIFIENTAGGTLSTGLRITETAGTITDAILISGTMGTILNTDTLDISGGGAITGGTGIVSSGTITFSGLSTGVVTNTSGTLSSEAQLALTRGGTNKDITATAGTVVYSDADSFELTAVGSTGQCLTSNGTGAPTWAGCDTAATTPFTTSGGIIDKTTAGDRLRLAYGDAADTQLTIENTTTGTIPTVDAMQIDLTGGTTGLVTDGADGLLIAAEFGNGTANTNSALHLDVNPIDTPSGDETFYALNIDGLAAGTSATEAAINVGANWDSILNTPSIDITGTGAITGATSFNGLVVTPNSGIITTGTWNGTTIAVANGGTGATTLTSNGVLYGNGTSAIGATTAGTNGQLLLGVTSSAPAFATMSGDATISNAGVLAISANAVELSTDTTGTYVGDVTAGSGISVSGTPAEGYTETIALGSLTANWSQTGAFDIVLNNADSQLGIRSADDAAFFGTIDVTTLAADRTYTFPDATGTVCLSTGNCTGLGGEITGSGAAGQAAFFTDGDSITSENNFEWDSTNDVLSLGTGTAAADTSALLDLYGESEYAVLRPADVTTEADTNNSPILRLRGTYDSDVAVGPVTSSNFNFDIRNIMTAAGASPASRLDFLNNSGAQMFSISSAGVVTVPGSADGTDALVITAGDLLVTDGDVDLSGGDFNVALDAADGVSILRGGASNSTNTLNLSTTTASSDTGGSTGLAVAQTVSDYADDGAADTHIGIDVVVNNSSTDAGTDDIVYGIRLQDLGGTTGQSNNEYGFYQAGTGWDYGIYAEDAVWFNTTANVNTDLAVNGNTTLGNANTDTITINAGTSGTGISFSDATFATCTALETVAGVLTCGTDGGGASTLQESYEGGNSITTAEADGDIDFILADTVSDQNFDIDINADNTVSITRAASASAEAPAQLLLLENADTDITVTSALGITNTGGNFTNGILLTDTAGGTFGTGLNFSGTFTTGIDLSGGSSTTDIILDDGATISQTSDADIDIVEGGLTLNLDFAETTASTITYSSASDLTFSSTAALNLTSSEAANDAIVLTTSNAAGGIDITSASTTVDALDVSLAINSGLGFDIDANSLTSGRVFDIASTATGITGTATTGSLLNLSASGVLTSAFVGNLGYIEWAPGSTATAAGNLLTVNIGTNGTTTGDLFQVQDTGSDLFRVNEAIITSALPHEFTAAGDVSIAYDIQFTNQTASYIKSKAPLYFDVGETFESNNATFNIYNAGGVVVDGSTDVNTGTTGVLDLNVNSITTSNVGFNLDYTINDGAGTAAELFGARLNLTQNDADSDMIGLEINAADTANAAADDYEALLRINGNDTTANSVSDYILITTAATDTTSDAIDVTDSGFFNALNIGNNFIQGDGIRLFASSSTVWTIEDTSGNDLCTITDNANVGDLNCTGAITQAGSPLTNYWAKSGTNLSPATAGDDILLPDSDTIQFGTGTDASITYDGTNLVIDPDLVGTGTVRIAGTEGADKFTITAGDAVVSDGSFLLTDDDDAVSFGVTNNTATTIGAGINTAGVVDLSSTSLTTGNLLNLETTTTLTTGTMLNLSSTATALAGTADSGRGLLANFDWNPGSSVTGTGDLFRIRLDANGSLSSGSIFNVVDESTSLFNVKEAAITSAVPHSFTAAGDVSVAYDLLFTNQTASTIKANGPLTIEQGESSENNNISIVTYGTGVVDVEGSTIQLDLPGGTTDEALCGNDADATTNDVLVDDCSGAPAADYAEVYPTAVDVEFGDIVVTGTKVVNALALDENNNVALDGSTEPVVELVKSNIPYQSTVIGIASNNYGDFSSIGHNRINEADHPLPIALNGRVPVKVSQESEAINPGDLITTSPEAGKAMKATSSGFIIAKALESWTPNSGKDTVLVFISNFYYSQPNLAELSLPESINSELEARVVELETQLALLQTSEGEMNLAPTLESLTVLGDTVLADTVVNGKLNVGTLTFDNVEQSINAVGVLKLQDLALGNIEFLGGLITFDTEGNIIANEITAEKYNVSGASAGTGTLLSGTKKVFVETTMATENSLVFVTPKRALAFPLAVTTKEAGVGFWVELPRSQSVDTEFDWFIVDKLSSN